MKKNGKRCISVGKCDKKYFFLVLAAIIINIILFFSSFGILIYALKYGNLMENIINPISCFFFKNFTESLMIIPGIILKKKTSLKQTSLKPTSKPRKSQLLENINELIAIQNPKHFNIKDKIYFIIFVILSILLDAGFLVYVLFLYKKFFNLIIDKYYFQFELIILFLISKLRYKFEFYKHQYISIIVITIFEVVNLVIQYFTGIEGEFFYDLFFNIGYAFFHSLMIIYIKELIENKYFSPYKVGYTFGLIKLVIGTIVLIIASFFQCEEDYCLLEYNKKKYFAHIFSIFTLSGLMMLGFYLFRAILVMINYIIINDFSVLHSFLLIYCSEIIGIKLILLDINTNLYYFIYYIVVYLGLGIFFILLFLEVIELNICGLSFYVKSNIQSRAMKELLLFNDEGDDSDEEEEIEENNSTNVELGNANSN